MFNDLQKAVLIKRYKRFLADVTLENGEEITIYCPNTGAMTNCADAGDQIWYSTSDNPKRKYQYTWELTHRKSGDWICVNTARANQLVSNALQQGAIEKLTGYSDIRAEVKYGSENSRIDFLLSDKNRPDCYVEVKSCTLLETQLGVGKGFFPDAVTKRGQKHLRELIEMKEQGFRSVLLFAVLHSGIRTVEAAGHIDAKYAELFEQAKKAGVEVICFYPDITPALDNSDVFSGD
ncbi:DNA/RNA nuclease SfsA [Psychromonas ossibalaenae]|uniref:DNA/RNA nuclease SfsA n=1 Tax=Psychromonas ossibalaenae TaxID=444922 RepID=UPI0003708D43|nr:DNA/RNA nuclease SfsA [Psychromonas ossibalaenae]